MRGARWDFWECWELWKECALDVVLQALAGYEDFAGAAEADAFEGAVLNVAIEGAAWDGGLDGFFDDALGKGDRDWVEAEVASVVIGRRGFLR
jgi:hypothetical protein